MTLFKTSLLSAFSAVIKLITLLGINKILAVYVGPTGYAALGQFQNAIQIITTFASGAINTGVTKYTAEYLEDDNKQYMLWKTAGTIALIGSVFTSLIIVVYSQNLAIFFLKDSRFGSVFLWFGITLIFFVFNSLLMAILNGKKEVTRYVGVNISGSIFSLIVSSILVVKYGLLGALLTMAINQSLVFIVTLVFCYQTTWFRLKYIIGRVDKKIAVNLGKYTAMAITSATVVPISHMLVRNHLGENMGWEAAGYWEAMWRLSAAYLMFITSTLSVYYLPRLSELKNSSALENEIVKGYFYILPIAILFGIIIYLMRDLIVNILFTEEFSPMRELFFWQLLGDTLKIGSWLLAYIMVGQALTTMYILTEVIFGIGFVFWTWALSDIFGYKAGVVAHAVNYGIYWAVMIVLIKSYLRGKRER